jgi:hypothetical protein
MLHLKFLWQSCQASMHRSGTITRGRFRISVVYMTVESNWACQIWIQVDSPSLVPLLVLPTHPEILYPHPWICPHPQACVFISITSLPATEGVAVSWLTILV